MDNELYDEYIRSVLGYSPVNNMDMDINKMQNSISNTELEKYYPEIYKIVYPMIKTKCNNCRGTVSRDEIENMVDEIYFAIEQDDTVNVNINVRSSQPERETRTTNKRQEVKGEK